MSQYQIYITSSTLPSTHPNQSVFPFTIASFPQVVKDKINNNAAIGAGFNDPDNFTGEVLNNTISSSFVSPSSPIGNKIRIIDTQTEGNILNPYLKIEKKSSFDELVDTNELFVGFSQTKQIDKDIISQLGTYFSLDQYIGEPSYQHSSSYDELRGIRKYYFNKYQGKNNINSFINLASKYDHSVLSLVEKIIPGRTNITLGTTIEPSILERSKIARLEPTVLNTTFSASINLQPTPSGEIIILEQQIEGIRFQSSSNLVDNNFDNYSVSENYKNSQGLPANYESGITLMPSSIYGRSQGLSHLSNPLITNPSPTSTLVYIFDSLIPYRAPIINLSPFSSELGLFFISSSDGLLSTSTSPITLRRTANNIRYEPGPELTMLRHDLRHVSTSSKFNIPEGSEISISGSFFQPNMGGFSLGDLPILGESVIVDNANSITGWVTSSQGQQYIIFTTSSGFPFPSGSSSSTFLRYQIIDYAYYGWYFPLLSKFYTIQDSGKYQVSFFVVSAQGDPDSVKNATLLVEILQNNQVRTSKKINFTDINYNPNIEQTIDFTSISSSFQLRFSHSGIGSKTLDYRIGSIATASYSSGYDAPYIKIRMLSGSYNNLIFTGTEILSTGEIKAPTSDPFTQNINRSERVNQNYEDVFLEFDFFTSKSFDGNVGAGNFISQYLNNPISINNLLIDTGETLEKYAFRIEKAINISTENVLSSEVINKDESYFVPFIDTELIPSFKFSVTSFADFPNRLKDSYHIFTASFGSRKDLVERGNLRGRNYIPIDLSIGENEEDDLPNFNNFDGGGVILPLNTNDDFKNNKQNIINFSKTIKNNNSLTF